MTTENLNIADLELACSKLTVLISQYANDIGRVRFPQAVGYEEETRYAARVFRENHGDLLDLRDKISDLVYKLKREASDKIVDIDKPTAQYKTQVETFYNTSMLDINKFLNKPGIIYVDLKITQGMSILVYKTIVYD